MNNFTFKTLLLLLLFASTFNANSTTYYVSNTGVDNIATHGLSPATPFLTLQFAAEQISAAGDSVIVADGTYAGFDYRGYRTGISGTNGNPVVFMASGNGAVITSGATSTVSGGSTRNDGINLEGEQSDPLAYIEINGFNIVGIGDPGNGVRLVWANNCTVRNCTSDGNQRGVFTGFTNDFLVEYNTCINSTDEHGIYVSNSSDNAIVRYNIIYNNNNIGIHMNGDASQSGGDGINHNPLIYGNIIHNNNLAAGINLDGVLNPIIYNNLIYDNHNAQGIAIFQGDGSIVSREVKIYNNTIVVPDDGRWGILVKDGGQVGTEIVNNILLTSHASRGLIVLENTSGGFVSDFNILQDRLNIGNDSPPAGSFAAWQGNGFDLNSQIVDLNIDSVSALFMDYAGGNFHLSNDSKAIDAGTNTPYPVDFDGSTRPMGSGFDIGAFESDIILATDDIASFNLRKLGTQVLLNWHTDYLNGIEVFRIQRSTNGIEWNEIEDVNYKNELQSYSWLDNAPLEGTSYYRVVSINVDGHSYPSNTQSISFNNSELKTSIYPNPSNGNINIKSANHITNIKVYSLSGQLIREFKNTEDISLSNLESGEYIIRVIDTLGISNHKVLIF